MNDFSLPEVVTLLAKDPFEYEDIILFSKSDENYVFSHKIVLHRLRILLLAISEHCRDLRVHLYCWAIVQVLYTKERKLSCRTTIQREDATV